MDEILDLLRELAEEKNLLQGEVSKAMGYNYNVFGQILNKASKLRAAHLEELAPILGLTQDEVEVYSKRLSAKQKDTTQKLKKERERVEFGQRIRKLRTDLNLKQVDVAEKLGMEKSNLSHVEKGDGYLTIPQLKKAVDVLKTSADFLLWGIENDAVTVKKLMQQVAEAHTDLELISRRVKRAVSITEIKK